MADLESGARARTRSVILDSAITVWSSDPSASLGAVAKHAGIGRTTLHRYYPERVALLRAVAREAMQRVREITVRIQHEGYSFPALLRRLTEALIVYGPIMASTYDDPELAGDAELWADVEDEQADAIAQFFSEHGEKLQSSISSRWASAVFWALLYAGGEEIQSGGMTTAEVVESIIATLSHGIVPVSAGVNPS